MNTPGSSSSAATIHPSCNPATHACDTTDSAGVGAFGIFVIVCVGLLLLAAITNRGDG